PAALGQRAEMAAELGTAGEVENEIRAAAAGGLPHLAGKVPSLQADLLDTESAEQLQPLAAAPRGEHSGAELAGELHREAPHAAGRAGHQHCFAGLDAAFGDQIRPGGEA